MGPAPVVAPAWREVWFRSHERGASRRRHLRRGQQIPAAIADAADLQEHPPAAAERTYVASRVIDQFEDGPTIAPAPRREIDPDRAECRLHN